ncbi:MAG: 2,3-bisphosphoglycerate-independent phosphoglycerate mutase [Myxococcota bacterium]
MSGPVVLVILDGFGIGDGGAADATAVAHTPFFERARRSYPTARIETSGESVGLPPGQMGNSEVGHMTIGAGRIVEQDMTRIGKAIEQGELERNAAVEQALAALERSGGTLHLIGLVSDGGVHSHIEHLKALLAHCGRRGVRPAVHVFLDGRDTPPRSGLGYLRELLPHVERVGGHVATVMGRYYAMDRDRRWERISAAYHAMVCREGIPATDALSAVEQAYARDESDEFVKPCVIEGGAPMADGDAVIFFNFRADRARQITAALSDAKPELFRGELERKRVLKPAVFVCLTEYDADYDLPVAFVSEAPTHILGEVLASAGLSQLRIAETEKYAHVTFFFNNGLEEPFPGEDRVLIPSPREIPTYDHKPEMSAPEVTEQLLRRLAQEEYAFVLLNFANCDMLGHTGILDAAVKAVETVDRCVERVADAVLQRGGRALITADHGNCEMMVDPRTGQVHTAHTTNPVPLLWIVQNPEGRRLRDGGLADLAPTVLDLLGLPAPPEMTGRSLIRTPDRS